MLSLLLFQLITNESKAKVTDIFSKPSIYNSDPFKLIYFLIQYSLLTDLDKEKSVFVALCLMTETDISVLYCLYIIYVRYCYIIDVKICQLIDAL